VALGAFAPGDVAGVSIAVGVLLVLWLVHAWARGHGHDAERDRRLASARERRGSSGPCGNVARESRAPITARRRPRPSKSRRDSFGTNGFAVGAPSLPAGAGIPA